MAIYFLVPIFYKVTRKVSCGHQIEDTCIYHSLDGKHSGIEVGNWSTRGTYPIRVSEYVRQLEDRSILCIG